MLKKLLALLLIFATVMLGTVPVQSAEATKVPILLYHHILSEEENKQFTDNSCTVSLEDFEAQMQYLYQNGFHALTLQELDDFLYTDKALPEKSVLITFDDGYYSNLVRAYPVLKRCSFRATIFMMTAATKDNQKPYDPDVLQFIAKDSMAAYTDVFEYASHTYDMHGLTADESQTKLIVSTAEEVAQDVTQSFDIVTNHEAFAYPRGQHSDAAIAGLKQAGITMAMTTKEGYVTKTQNPLLLNRFIIYRETTFEQFKQIVNGKRN